MTQTESPVKLSLIVGLGMFLSTLDAGIVNVAIPSLIQVFNTSITSVIWTVVGYNLVLCASLVPLGQFADRVGRLRIYTLGLSLFCISSLLCGLTDHIGGLIAFRVIQGLSAAMLQATSMALIVIRTSGEARAKAMACLAILLGLGPLLGPVVGGLLLDTIGWRWLFWLNIPLCLWGLYACSQLSQQQEPLDHHRINYLSASVLALGLTALIISIQFAGVIQVISGISAMVILLSYACIEFTVSRPMLDFRLFKKLHFTAPMLGVISMGGATAVVFMLPPIYFSVYAHYSMTKIGLLSLVEPLAFISAANFSSKIAAAIGEVKTMVIGLSAMTISLCCLANMQLHWPTPLILALLLIYGVGGGTFQIPSYMYLTAQFPPHRQAFITALTRMLQNLAITLEASMAAALIHVQPGHTHSEFLLGLQQGWSLAAFVCGTALLSLVALLFRTTSNVNSVMA